MRLFLLLFLAASSACTSQTSQPTALEFVGCENVVTHINVAAGTTKVLGLPDIEATQDGCAAQNAISLPGNKAIILVKTQQSVSLDDKITVELHRYALPSWKLEAKRVIPEKIQNDSYLVPSVDGKAFFVVGFSDNVSGVSERRGFEATDSMQPIKSNNVEPLDFIGDENLGQFLTGANRDTLLPYVYQIEIGGKNVDTLGSPLGRVPGATLYVLDETSDHPSLFALLRSGGRLTTLNVPGAAYLANTGDAILVHSNKRTESGGPWRRTDEIAVYSADTSKQTALIKVPVLANKEAKCIALWHDQLAVFLLPKSFVVVDFTKKTFKVIPHDNQLDSAADSHALWVESVPGPPKSAK